VRVAGDRMDQAVIEYIRRTHGLLIGTRSAERVKIEVGCATPLDEPRSMVVKGRDLRSGVPTTREVDSNQIYEALREPVAEIVDTISITLENTPPELAADIMDQGIILAGGGAMLANLDVRIREVTALPVIVAPDPLVCVANGAGAALESLDLLRRVTQPA